VDFRRPPASSSAGTSASFRDFLSKPYPLFCGGIAPVSRPFPPLRFLSLIGPLSDYISVSTTPPLTRYHGRHHCRTVVSRRPFHCFGLTWGNLSFCFFGTPFLPTDHLRRAPFLPPTNPFPITSPYGRQLFLTIILHARGPIWHFDFIRLGDPYHNVAVLGFVLADIPLPPYEWLL